jgi:hypothetical protein
MPNAHTRTKIELSDDERAELMSMARSRSLPAALALRAKLCWPAKESTSPAQTWRSHSGSIEARSRSGAGAMRVIEFPGSRTNCARGVLAPSTTSALRA